MTWKSFLELARESARQIETLTFRINNGGRDWSAGGVKTRSTVMTSPTESAALMEMTIVPQLEEQRERHERCVGNALVGIQAVRDGLGVTEGDILEMFYIDGMLTGYIAGELGLTVDGVFYRKRRSLEWMDENLSMPR